VPSQRSKPRKQTATGDERTGVRILARALQVPAGQIADNAGADDGVVIERIRAGTGFEGFDARTRTFVDLDDAGIIDPTKVVRTALENAVSVAGVMLLAAATMVELEDTAAAPEHDLMCTPAGGPSTTIHCDSHVRVGFGPDDHRPSQGRGPSGMHREFQAAAREIGADIHAVATVLTAFLHRLPTGERDHVLAHLPADVRALVEPVDPHGTGRIADEAALRDAVTASGTVPEQQADKLIRAVFTVLRRRVPEEISDIEAVLPAGLKPLWADPLGEAPPRSPVMPRNEHH
jgi:uncharacterized protein (DUF2267 family)